MASDGATQVRFSAVAGADLSAKQHFFVKFSADRTVVVCAAATDKPCGVLTNNPTSGKMAAIVACGQVSVVGSTALAGSSYPALIGTDTNGRAAPYVPGSDTTEYYVGQLMGDVNAAQGGLVTALVNCINPVRSA